MTWALTPLTEEQGDEVIAYAEDRASEGHVAKARKYNMMRFTSGTSISKDSHGEKPAFL